VTRPHAEPQLPVGPSAPYGRPGRRKYRGTVVPPRFDVRSWGWMPYPCFSGGRELALGEREVGA
jgi:hypothetical protein